MYVLIIILIRTYPTSEKHPISNILRKFTCTILRTEVIIINEICKYCLDGQRGVFKEQVCGI